MRKVLPTSETTFLHGTKSEQSALHLIRRLPCLFSTHPPFSPCQHCLPHALRWCGPCAASHEQQAPGCDQRLFSPRLHAESGLQELQADCRDRPLADRGAVPAPPMVPADAGRGAAPSLQPVRKPGCPVRTFFQAIIAACLDPSLQNRPVVLQFMRAVATAINVTRSTAVEIFPYKSGAVDFPSPCSTFRHDGAVER